MSVSISCGNSKMGKIKSVSLTPVVTCGKCECAKKCYALKLMKFRPNVRKAYENNYRILTETPDVYWREVEAAIMSVNVFRFHVAGDIVDMKYLDHMVDIADRNRHCQILCFTKKYGIVNKYLDNNGEDSIPENLHIVFSGWVGMPLNNPYNLPEAHVKFKSGVTTAADYAMPCSGNCTKCIGEGKGCWLLKKGEQVVFKEH